MFKGRGNEGQGQFGARSELDDARVRMRHKTVALIVDSKLYVPGNSAKYFVEVSVPIDYHEQELRERAKVLGARWYPRVKK